MKDEKKLFVIFVKEIEKFMLKFLRWLDEF